MVVYVLFMDLNIHHKKIGRAKMKIEVNFNDPFKNVEEIERLSKLDGMK